jgi:hypothetical protein
MAEIEPSAANMVPGVGSYRRSIAARAPALPPRKPLDGSSGESRWSCRSSPAKPYFQLVAPEAQAWQQLRRKFAAGDLRAAERAGVVAVEAPGHHRLEGETFAVESAGRPQQAAIGEVTIAPDVAASKQ